MESNEEDFNVLDLPQVWQQPTPSIVLAALHALRSESASFSRSERRCLPNASRTAEVSRYLTTWVSSSLAWLESDQERESIWEEASKRLAEQSGRSALPDFIREVSIPQETQRHESHASTASCLSKLESSKLGSHEHERPVGCQHKILLYEPSLTGDCLGHKTWVGAYILACHIGGVLRRTSAASRAGQTPEASMHILELGAGTGLAGIATAALVPRGSTVHLTDLPEIVANLAKNIRLNEQGFAADLKIHSFALDWNNLSAANGAVTPKYDLILAADLLYETNHVKLVVNAIAIHLRRREQSRVCTALPFRSMGQDFHKDFRTEMFARDFRIDSEGKDFGLEDWIEGEARQEVQCWWCFWRWRADS